MRRIAIIVVLLLKSFSFAAISWHATGSANNTTSNSVGVNLPAVSNNDLALVFFVADRGSNGGSWALPSGYTACFNFAGWAWGYHVWHTGDATSVTGTSSAGGTWRTGIAATYSGVDTSTPVDHCNASVGDLGAGGNTSFDTRAPRDFPNYANDMLLVSIMDSSGSGATYSLVSPASGFTNRISASPGPNVGLWEKQLSNNNPTSTITFSGSGTSSTWGGVQILLHAASDPSVGRQGPYPTFRGYRQADNVSSFDLTRFNVQNNDFVQIDCYGAPPVSVSTTGYTARISGSNLSVYTHTWLTGDATTIALSGTGWCSLGVFDNPSTATAVAYDNSSLNAGTGTSLNTTSLGASCALLTMYFYDGSSSAGVFGTISPSVQGQMSLKQSGNPNLDEAFVETPATTGSYSTTNTQSAAIASGALALKITGSTSTCTGGSGAVRHNVRVF